MATLSQALISIALTWPTAGAQDALTDCRVRYQLAEDARRRIEALELIAKLEQADDAPAPDELCEALALGLEDELMPVRVRAVELIGGVGSPEAAAATLLEATRGQIALEDRIHEMISELELADPHELFSKKEKEREKAKKELEESLDRMNEVRAFLESVEGHDQVRAALVGAWSGIADDRAVEGLSLLFVRGGFGERADPIADGLLAIGTMPALEALVDHIERYGEMKKERDKRGRELKRMRPGKKPSALWADDVWKEKERERIAAMQAEFTARAAEQDEWTESYADRLRQFGADHGLVKPPRNLIPARNWSKWAVKAREVLPASVAGG